MRATFNYSRIILVQHFTEAGTAAAAPPAPAAAAAAAEAGHPMLVTNFDETGFRLKVCALHSYKHLHTPCSGCVCKCEAQDIYVKIPAANVHFYYLSDSEDDDEDSSPKDM